MEEQAAATVAVACVRIASRLRETGAVSMVSLWFGTSGRDQVIPILRSMRERAGAPLIA
jgi:hypothetical protein